MSQHSIQIPLRGDHPYTLAVWARFGPSMPVPDLLLRSYSSWLERNADKMFAASLRSWLHHNAIDFQVLPCGKLPAPPLPVLRIAAHGREEENRLADATHEIVITAKDGAGEPLALWSVLGAARAAAEAYSAVILDRDVPRLLAVSTYGQHLDAALHVADHICVVPQDKIRGLRACGMRKFQLPALEIGDVPDDLVALTSRLLQVQAQVLAFRARKQLRRAGPLTLSIATECKLDLNHESLRQERMEARPARRWTVVGLKWLPSRGDTEDVLRLVPPASTADAGSWVRATVADLFGLPQVEAPPPKATDDTASGHERALEEFAEIKRRYRSGLPYGHRLCVKRAFPTTKGVPEYLWIQVSSWMDGVLRGSLVSDPRMRLDLNYGQMLQLQEEDVYDWMILCPDGSSVGCYTERTGPRIY